MAYHNMKPKPKGKNIKGTMASKKKKKKKGKNA